MRSTVFTENIYVSFFYVDHIWLVGKEILTHLCEDRFVKSIFYFLFFNIFFSFLFYACPKLVEHWQQ